MNISGTDLSRCAYIASTRRGPETVTKFVTMPRKDEVNGELCPHCEAPISWGITLGTISADLSSISKANDKGHWSIRTDYCKYCRGWDSPVHPYKSLPQYLSFDYDGECSNVKVCDEHLKKFEQEEERRSRSRHRRYLRGQ